MNNHNSNYGEFALIKEKSGLNNFKISVKKWVSRTGAIVLHPIFRNSIFLLQLSPLSSKLYVRDEIFAIFFDDKQNRELALINNRRNELEPYKLLTNDPAFKAAMQQSLREMIGR